MKLTIFSILILFLLSSKYLAQGWVYNGNFPNDNFTGGAGCAGISVDPEGKVWICKFAAEYFTPPSENDSLFVRLIYVFNPDGTPSSFSPIWRIAGPGFSDTLLYYASRGLRTDNNGDILYVNSQFMYRIDYQSGQGLNRVELGLGSPPTTPGVSDSGNIFVGPVINLLNPIKEFGYNFNFISNSILFNQSGFSRALEVSSDGNTIYFPNWIWKVITVYNRLDEFSPFDSLGSIMEGAACESITFEKLSGKLWISGGSYSDPPAPGTPWSPNTWYEYDVNSGAVTDSIKWVMNIPNNLDERPRAIDFSPDARYAYIGCFGSGNFPIVQKFEYPIVPVELSFFGATPMGSKSIILNWETSSEVNNLGFEIEKKILNNENRKEWMLIGFVKGNGTSTESNNYSFIDDIRNISATSIIYRLKQIDYNGNYEYSQEVVINNLLPVEFSLQQNFPNPFNPSTTIKYSIPETGYIKLKIYDILGNEVVTLVNEEKAPGNYSVELNATQLASGVYFYQLKAGEYISTKKMILLK